MKVIKWSIFGSQKVLVMTQDFTDSPHQMFQGPEGHHDPWGGLHL